MTFTIELQPPPSSNGLYINRRGRRGRTLDLRYRQWRDLAVVLLRTRIPLAQRIAGPSAVVIRLPLKLRGDVDNRAKAVLNALVLSGSVDDDRHPAS